MSDIPSSAETAAKHKRRPRGWALGLIIGATAVLVVGVLAVVGATILGAQRTPEAAVARFFDALIAGDTASVLATLDSRPAGPDFLMTGGALKGSSPSITAYRIERVDRNPSITTVIVEITQDGETYTAGVTVDRLGKELLVFDTWRVDNAALPRVRIIYPRPAGMTLAVNGVDIPEFTTATAAEIPALPGTYAFEPVGSTENYAAQPATVSLLVTPVELPTVELPVALTDAGMAAARAAVDAHVESCTAQATIAPGPACNFSVIETSDSEYSSMSWTLLTRPTVTFKPYVTYDGSGTAELGEGWPVIADAPGSARWDATRLDGRRSTATMSAFYQAGMVSFSDGAAHYLGREHQ